MQLNSSGGGGFGGFGGRGAAVKDQVVDEIPKRFSEMKFGIQYASP
jgi:hypothetical protein